MKIVIDIDKETYYKVLGSNNRGFLLHAFAGILQTGTILPKGHGRLIDADMLLSKAKFLYKGYEVALTNTIGEAPTIIEADKEENT